MSPAEAKAIRERIKAYDEAEVRIQHLQQQVERIDRLKTHALKIEHIGATCSDVQIDGQLQDKLRGWLISKLCTQRERLEKFQRMLDCPEGRVWGDDE